MIWREAGIHKSTSASAFLYPLLKKDLLHLTVVGWEAHYVHCCCWMLSAVCLSVCLSVLALKAFRGPLPWLLVHFPDKLSEVWVKVRIASPKLGTKGLSGRQAHNDLNIGVGTPSSPKVFWSERQQLGNIKGVWNVCRSALEKDSRIIFDGTIPKKSEIYKH